MMFSIHDQTREALGVRVGWRLHENGVAIVNEQLKGLMCESGQF